LNLGRWRYELAADGTVLTEQWELGSLG